MRTIQEQLAQEHKVLKGEAQRKPITDPVIEAMHKKREHMKTEKQINYLCMKI
jgi:hypothetical protein